MKTIFIIRHGETEQNRKGIVQGSGVNSSLNETGRKQAQAFFDTYNKEDFEVVLTSTLKRTHETAKGFIDKGIPWEQWAEIREISWGVQEGLVATDESVAEYRAVVNEWRSGNFDARLEEGESARELSTRIDTFITALKKRSEKKILVVSHGRTMRSLICQLKGIDINDMGNQKHTNTGLYKAHFDGTIFQFELENDTSHL